MTDPNLLESKDTDKMMNKISRELEKCKHKSFGKVKVKNKFRENKELKELIKKRKEICMKRNEDENDKESKLKSISEEINEKILEEQNEMIGRDIKNLQNLKNEKGSSKAIFKLRESIVGPKKSELVPTVIRNPDTGKEETNPEKIKDVSVKFVRNLLTNRKPREEYVEDLRMKRLLHNARMEENTSDIDTSLSRNDFEASWNTIMKTKKEKYKFIMNAGPDVKEALFALFKQVWK